MNRRYLALVLALLALMLISVGLAAAQDAPPENLCDQGQLWDDGRCQIPQYEGATELAWECGWYMAHILYQGMSIEAMPDQCAHLIQAGIAEICRTVDEGPELIATLCLRADQTATMSIPFEDLVILIRFIPILPLGPEDCPVIPGYVPVSPVETSILELWFTADELYNQLGLLPY
ncbi:MAG: hypothetical protein KC547_20075, partial [Anaerolineae bacterium]|nr:hypothetical protein [Anaerolineae bacterium]